jgi:hypothetical protein
MPNKGEHHSEESKQLLREARKRQIHPRLVAHGITSADIREAESRGLRWCSGKCKAFRPADEFYENPYPRCKLCTQRSLAKQRANRTPEERQNLADYTWDWREKNKGHVRKAWLKSKYGVTPEWYESKLAEQGGHCAVCSEAMVKGRKFLFVDHNHKCCANTKKTCGKCVRGLLCYRCNTYIEPLHDPVWLASALAYLERYKMTSPIHQERGVAVVSPPGIAATS